MGYIVLQTDPERLMKEKRLTAAEANRTFKNLAWLLGAEFRNFNDDSGIIETGIMNMSTVSKASKMLNVPIKTLRFEKEN